MRQLRRRPEPSGERRGSAVVAAILAWMDEQPWAYYVGYMTVASLWGSALWLCFGLGAGHSRVALPIAGLLAIIGGMVEIFLAKPLAEIRNSAPWLLRVWEEGMWGTVEYGPATFRFFGSAAVGCGLGAWTWVVFPNVAAAAVVGIVGCLTVWIWTWFAFPVWDS